MADMFQPIPDKALEKDSRERSECVDGFCPLPTPKEVVIDDEISPEHYRGRGGVDTIEAIDVMEAFLSTEEFTGYLRGNAIKYLLRLKSKGSAATNAKKCNWYVNRLVEELE